MPIRLTAHFAREFTGPQAALAAMGRDFLPRLEEHPDIQAYAVPGRDIEIRVIFGGRRECRQWGVPAQAMGFHAVASKMKWDGRREEYWRKVADSHDVHVNMDAAMDIGEWWDRNQVEDRESDLESWLFTVPHEVLHALEWIRETGGRTPDEMFEEGDIDAINRTSRAIRTRLNGGRPDGDEDHIEFHAREVTYATMPKATIERLGATPWGELGAAPAAPATDALPSPVRTP